MINVGVVLLAAGASTRMGQPKLLLPWERTTVLGHLIRQWKELGARQIAVVCAASDGLLAAELDRLSFPAALRIVNSTPERGMHSSILCAVDWAGWDQELTHLAIALGDQPHLRVETLRRLVSEARGDAIYQPSRRGRGRHPVLLPRRLFQELHAVSMLKEFLTAKADEVVKIEIDDPGLELDMDRPEDYLAAQRLAGVTAGAETEESGT